ncbi:MAG: hypothetical protein KIT02_09100 [Devosia sp.]|uniref:hypothetical protein n=1 Tax=Devosia sp. TaxID=1871048 RepID=UPI0024C9BB97|nr:hypothetical protein [Devosia sp.]UYN98140.1 MAG: hypothetical protein KIT02_09100 [Devosia sp.]
MSEPRPVSRSFLIVVFGPLVGTWTILALTLAMSGMSGTPLPASDLGYVLGVGLLLVSAFGWLAGLPPAIVSAIAWHFVGPRVQGSRTVAAALAIGALSGMALGWPIFVFYLRASQITPQGFGLLALAGAVAMAATALPGRGRGETRPA